MTYARPTRWPTFTALAIALIGVAVGLVGWFRPVPHSDQPPTPHKPTYTDGQTADAKAHMCTAFGKVDHALDISGARKGSDDPTAQLAIATSGRQVLDAGSRYLLSKLAEEPATPPNVANEVRKFASSSQELVIGYLGGLTNSDGDLQPSLHAGDEATLAIRRLCK
jgi:hypothetical protein